MAVRITGPVEPADAARLRALAEEALAALGSDLDVPIAVVDRTPQGWDGWADSPGVYLVANQLDHDDNKLRYLVAEELAHLWLKRRHPEVGEVLHECFATRFVARHCAADWEPGDLGQPYQLARALGGALAGGSAARTGLDKLDFGLRLSVSSLYDRMDGVDDPIKLTQRLAAYQRGSV
jgi:hypothetical protein